MSSFQDKVIVITGGSSGLGLHLARAFCEAQARVIILGRNAERLSEAVDQLGKNASSYPADVTSNEQVAAAFAHVSSKFDQLDVLVNCVGKSDRGRASELAPADFQSLWEANFLTAVRCVQAALPMIRASKGSIINIGSLASKTGGRYLGAYPASKFPLAAYSQQLRMELSDDGVNVLLVCPGPIQRDDAGDRYNEESGDLPAVAKKPGGGANLKLLNPITLSSAVLFACERRRAELVLPGKTKLLFAISAIWPKLGDWLLRKNSS